MNVLRTISYGGGVQSTALLVLAARGMIDDIGRTRIALFANVGEHAENPATLAYVRDVAIPFCAEHGIELVELNRGGKNPDLYDRLTRPGSTFLGIPVRMTSGKPGQRSCTADYKAAVIGRELKRRGASVDSPAQVAIGISTDEYMRANRRRSEPWEQVWYPLLDLGYSRGDCLHIIADAGLPTPERSACWFCPFHSKTAWRNMRTQDPAMFERAAQLEDALIARRAASGKDPVYLADGGKPLRDQIPDLDFLPFADDPPEESGTCDSGWCMT